MNLGPCLVQGNILADEMGLFVYSRGGCKQPLGIARPPPKKQLCSDLAAPATEFFVHLRQPHMCVGVGFTISVAKVLQSGQIIEASPIA